MHLKNDFNVVLYSCTNILPYNLSFVNNKTRKDGVYVLQLDFLSDNAKAAFEKNGVRAEDIALAVHLDLDFKGEFGDTWLAIDPGRKRLCRLGLDPEFYDEYELALLALPYIDNFTSSNRLLATEHDRPAPDREELGEAFEEALDNYQKEGTTIVLAY